MGVPVVTLAAPKQKPLHAWNVGKGMNTTAGLTDLIAHSEDEVRKHTHAHAHAHAHARGQAVRCTFFPPQLHIFSLSEAPYPGDNA
jgi:hypothetical protein